MNRMHRILPWLFVGVLVFLFGCTTPPANAPNCNDLISGDGFWGKNAVPVPNSQDYVYTNCFDPSNTEMQSDLRSFGITPPDSFATINILCRARVASNGEVVAYTWQDQGITECSASQTCEVTTDGLNAVCTTGCTPSCPDPSTAACGAPVSPITQCSASCGSCECPSGTQCTTAGEVCTSNGCQVPGTTRKYVFDVSSGSDNGAGVAPTSRDPNDPNPPPGNPVTLSLPFFPAGSLNAVRLTNAEIQAQNWSFLPGSRIWQAFKIETPRVLGTGNYYAKLFVQTEDGRSQTFNVKLKSGTADACESPDGIPGTRGLDARPRVLLEWNWQSINRHTCTDVSTPSRDGVFCDSTQFMISLLDRLRLISQRIDNSESFLDLTTFQVQMMKDGLSDDFRRDFDYFMQNVAFFEAPGDYEQNLKMLVLPGRMKFELEGVESDSIAFETPGVYEVIIKVVTGPEDSAAAPFDNDASNFVSVNLVRKSDPLEPNAWYSLAFDAQVGFQKRPDETSASREGYGVSFAGENLPIALQVVTQNSAGSGPKITVEKSQEFWQTQVTERGRLFAFDAAQNEINWSPNNATPIAVEIAQAQGSANAQFFYRLKENNNAFGYEVPIIDWKTLADSRTSALRCPMPGFLEELPSAGSCVQNPGSNLGYTWGVLEPANGRVFVQTVFFTPAEKQFVLESTCGTFVSPLEKITSGQPLNLNYTSVKQKTPQTLEELLNLVSDRKVCVVANSASEISFYWHEPSVYGMMENKSANANTYDFSELVTNANWFCPNRVLDSGTTG